MSPSRCRIFFKFQIYSLTVLITDISFLLVAQSAFSNLHGQTQGACRDGCIDDAVISNLFYLL